MSYRGKPGRPLGVTIAVFTSVCLFSVFPQAQLALLWIVRSHIHFEDGIATGMDVLGVEYPGLVLQVLLGLGFLVIAFFAWRGRPAYMRSVMVLSIIALMAVSIIINLLPSLFEPVCSQLPCDSSIDLKRQVACIQLPLTLLVPAYVVWYLNRGPARAFYRGYYLTDPADKPVDEPASASK